MSTPGPAGEEAAGGGVAESVDDDGFEALRVALVRFLAADRKLRGRDGRTGGANPPFSQLRALFLLLDEPEVTAGTLARVAEVNPASVTAMVDQLEAAGIVERRRDTEDRRAVKISLTEAGRIKVRAKEQFVRERFDEYFSGVTAGEIAAATKVLHQAAGLLASFAEPDGGAPAED